jgi:chitinase
VLTDKQINIGATFSPLAGVTDLTKKDGDLTIRFIVTGLVDTSKVESTM